ncbi:putative ATP-dependent DNA helicase [Gordonia araii NBRC 100433]|uniref:DNA 3'-5' helicase n=1 Tax=Gordonia araii NBRC 100433 TaxID=1073574 RepID=G7H735_9ACTN|nr:DEAD/DEAH box helicase [Gordonia araii]NNG97656.1 ATP-dependent DNA helicase RecQ [Gordonia araii NBRC 100433]GAB11660.1 putative ATP-dependent DNA helicase [Gordonia araii NBRC 100433]
MALDEAQREKADGVVRALAGPDARLRDDQLTAVEKLVEPGARVLVVQATGWGKSAVYWVTTALTRAAGAGPTLVVSPLLALMRDQVEAAARAGLRAATINSSNFDDWSAIEDAVRAGDLDVLLVSPERLANPGFGRRVLSALAGPDSPGLGLLVIDEAHAISDWGHDFRPDYRRVADVLRELHPDSPVLATTATANERVTADVAVQLGADTTVLRGPLARKSLYLNVISDLSPIQRYAWVAENIEALPGSGIVYALTVADTDRLVAAIKAVRGPDYPVAAYTGQLDAASRQRLEDALGRNEIKALVATSALGMGYDKPDLGFVVHVGSPPSPVSYYQQVGRAGRALDAAVVMLLASGTDDRIWEYFATASIPDPRQMSALLDALPDESEPTSVVALEAQTGLRRTKIDLMLKQLAVDGAAERGTEGWSRTGKPWTYDAAHYDGILAVRRREADIMRSYIRGERCLMQLLTASLDDPLTEPCGRCSVCRAGTGESADLSTTVSDDSVRTITRELRGASTVLEPRKMWPGGAFGTRGRIQPAQMAEPGRVLAHADAPEWQEVLIAAQHGDEQALRELSDAAVATLGPWGRESGIRPDQIWSLRLTGHTLAADLAEELRRIGKRTGGTVAVRPGGPSDEANSAAEAAHWRDAISLLDEQEAPSGAVLLVVDDTRSGWPVTIAAQQLRDAGAAAVLPLVIHRSV